MRHPYSWALSLCAFSSPWLVSCSSGSSGAPEATVEGLPEWTLEEVSRIGSRDDPDVGFSRIRGVSESRDGRVFVLDVQARQVRVFDREGRFLRSVGRSGAGPGEFSNPQRMGVVGDTLWVIDVANRRFTLFDLDGVLQATLVMHPVSVSLSIPGLAVAVAPTDLRADGRFDSSIEIGVAGGVRGSNAAPDSATVAVVVFDESGAVVDTVGYQSFGGRHSNLVIYDGLVSVLPGELNATPIRTPFVGGAVVVERAPAATRDAAHFTITRLAPDGDTIYRNSYHYEAEAVPRAYADSVVNAAARPVHGEATASSLGSALRQRLADFPHYPPIVAVVVGEDGSVWARRHTRGGAEARWIVVEPDGTPRGTVLLSSGATIYWVGGERIWAVETDEIGVPWLVGYRVVKASTSDWQP